MQAIGNGYIERDCSIPLADSGAPGGFRYVSEWRMATNDAAAAITGANFFNPLAAKLKVGDSIRAHVDVDGTPDVVLLVVTANASGVVTVVDTDST